MCSVVLSSFTSSHDEKSIFDFNTWYLHHSPSGTSFQGSSSLPADERGHLLQVSARRVDICRSRIQVKSSSLLWHDSICCLCFSLLFRRTFLLFLLMMEWFLLLNLIYLHDNYRSLRISEIDNLYSVNPSQNLCKISFFDLKNRAKLHFDLMHHNIFEMIIKS